MPPKLPTPLLLSALLAREEGKPISYKPKNDKAKNTNTAKKIKFNQTFVEILLKISGLMVLLAK